VGRERDKQSRVEKRGKKMQTNLGEPAASKPLESPFIGYNSVHECVIVVEEGKILEKERVKMTFGEFSRSLNLMGLAHFNIFTWLRKKEVIDDQIPFQMVMGPSQPRTMRIGSPDPKSQTGYFLPLQNFLCMSSPLEIPPVREVSIISVYNAYYVPTTLQSCSPVLPDGGPLLRVPPQSKPPDSNLFATVEVIGKKNNLVATIPLQETGQHMVAPPVPESSIIVSLAGTDVWLSEGKEGSCSYSFFGIEVLNTKVSLVGEGLSPWSIIWNSFINKYVQLERYVEVFKYFKKIQWADSLMLLSGNGTRGYVRRICVVGDGTTIIIVGGDLMNLKLREAFSGSVFWFMMLSLSLIGMYCN
jgi:hypothetical protein